jgi:hypothetical protein
MQLDQKLLLLAAACLGGATGWSAAGGRLVLLVSLDHQPACLFFLHHPLQARLHLACQMQQMPPIALMGTDRLGRLQGFGNGPASITDAATAHYALLLQIP